MMKLQAFPVQYPAGPWNINRLKQDFNRPRWSLEIFFRNSYNDPRGGAFHHAIDIMGAVGLPVVSTVDGIVAPYYFTHLPPTHGPSTPSVRDGVTRFFGADCTNDSGNILLIVDHDGFLHYYAHLDLRTVTPGQTVAHGTLVGILGKTGRLAAGGPSHLHYQVIGPYTDTGPFGVRVPNRTEPVSTGELPKRVENPYEQLVVLARKYHHAIEGRTRARGDTIYVLPFDQPPRSVSGFTQAELLVRRAQILDPRQDPSVR